MAPANKQVAKFRALIVDDDRVTRMIHEAMLKKFDFDISVAKNGKEAVDLFASGECYDLVLMDLEMPVMKGTKATEELRGMGVNSLIVGVTACDSKAEKEAFMNTGLDQCLAKPLNMAMITQVVEGLAKE